MIGFTVDEVQTIKMSDDPARDYLPLPFDEFDSRVVIGMMQSIDRLPGLGLGMRQQGVSDLVSDVDRNLTFGLGFESTHQAHLHRDCLLDRLRHLPFDYLIRSYSQDWLDYFVPVSTIATRSVKVPIYDLYTSAQTAMEQM